jgi:alkanesulfonate monooxygenase SsuD/methylene tetrahydromethanopterin reductase-like flavin-dependent oxidoreductase (luciferase family)
MCCLPGKGEAATAFRTPINKYMNALMAATSGWLKGSSTKDYPGYDKAMAALREENFDSQLARGICWAGTPDEVAAMIADYAAQVDFESASLQVNPHGFDLATAERSIRLFSREVMPRFA